MNGLQERASEMTTIEYLKAARALISDERNWCQSALAKKTGEGCISYCAIGALCAVEEENRLTVGFERLGTKYYMCEEPPSLVQASAHMALGEQSRINGFSSIPAFNNTSSHKRVLQLFDDTIARLEELESGKDIDVINRGRNSNSTQVLQPV